MGLSLNTLIFRRMSSVILCWFLKCIFLLVSLGGLWHSSLIHNHVVDYFVPFLPLEHRHVVMCVKAEMVSKGLKPDPDIRESGG